MLERWEFRRGRAKECIWRWREMCMGAEFLEISMVYGE